VKRFAFPPVLIIVLGLGLSLALFPQAAGASAAPTVPAATKIVGYFPQWGIYGNYVAKNLVTSGSAPLLTHINYAFGNIVNNQCQSYDTLADYQYQLPASDTVNGVADSSDPNAFAGNFHQFQELKQLYPKLKILMSIGGGSLDPALWSSVAAKENREAFVKSCIDMYIQGNFAAGINQPGIFDGFDIDWEFPSSPSDRVNLTKLLAEFRRQLDALRPGLMLTLVAPPGSWAFNFIDLDKVQPFVDFFNVETYDYDGPWENETGLVAPLYRTQFDPSGSNNADATIQTSLRRKLDPQKMMFGIPFYGYAWTAPPGRHHGLFQPGTPVDQGDGDNYIATIAAGYTKYRDPVTKAPWLYDGTTFWTYDDPTSIWFKMKYVQEQHLGGVMIWELSSDLPNGRLLKSIVKGLERAQTAP
jgi:chitinase